MRKKLLFSHCYSSLFNLWSALWYVVCLHVLQSLATSSFTFIIHNAILCHLVQMNVFGVVQSSSTAPIGGGAAHSSTTVRMRRGFGPGRPLQRTRERAVYPRMTRGPRMSTTSPGSGRKRTFQKPSLVRRRNGQPVHFHFHTFENVVFCTTSRVQNDQLPSSKCEYMKMLLASQSLTFRTFFCQNKSSMV